MSGLHAGRCYRVGTGEAYIGAKPSKKRVARVCERISQISQAKLCCRDTEEVVGELNLVLRGWAHYFRPGAVSKAYRAVDSHARYRLRQWLCCKHKAYGQGRNRFPKEYLDGKLGLFCPGQFSTRLPWARAKRTFVRKPAGNPHGRFDERDLETEDMVSYSDTDKPNGSVNSLRCT